MTRSALSVVLLAAASHAAAVEQLADHPFRLLNAQTPQHQVDAWRARQRELAAEIRAAIAELEEHPL